MPAFSDIAQNPGNMGCLTRVPEEEGDRGSDGYSFGEKILNSEGFNYFYSAPTGHFSSSTAELQLERHAISLIKNMLSSENVLAYN